MNKIEEGKELMLSFDKSTGLMPAIVQDITTKEILMLAYVNEEAFLETLDSSYATFYSRSRQTIWKKGETSGNLMRVKEIRIDCDQDALIYLVEPAQGGACHTKENGAYRNSCFYRKLEAPNFQSPSWKKL